MILIILPGRSFRATLDLSRMLYHAALNDPKKERKEAPLFTESGIGGAPTLRIRTLQHMTVIHLKRLAVLAEDIMSSRTATESQMDRVQEVPKDYGRTMFASISLKFGFPINPKCQWPHSVTSNTCSKRPARRDRSPIFSTACSISTPAMPAISQS